MGQSASADSPTAHRTVSNAEIVVLFAQQCAKGLQPIELMALKKRLSTEQKTLTNSATTHDIITETDFHTLLQLPDDHPHVRHLLFSIVSKLSQFPLLAHSQTPLTSRGLLVALTLLNKERCSTILGGQVHYLKLVFVALATQPSRASPVHMADTQTVIYQKPGMISWSDTPAVKLFDELNFEEMFIPADDLLTVLACLLALIRLHPTHSLKQYTSQLSQPSSYKKHALPILMAMNPDITAHDLSGKTVSYTQFTSAIESVAPHILTPLTSILETLLYDQDPEESTTSPHEDDSSHHSRLINAFSLAQLSTYFEPDLIHANIRKLYVGRDSGFSMRSFESKVFKWNAPSFLFLKGTRITSEKAGKSSRYKKFEEHYPRLPSSSNVDVSDKEEAIVYGVYVDTPWKVSNKETFGTSKTVIFQLSPVQRVFTTSITAKHFVYFSTLGGGIGIGSQLPTLKGNNELVRYNPGNVSLTMDSSLEFAVFRNLGLGGEFKSNTDVCEYEDRFMISDVEVWGCGGAKELEEQNKRWEWEQAEAKRRQNINLKSMGEDKALLEMAGLIGQHQSGGSV